MFLRVVSAEIILFWKWKMWKISYSFHIMAISYFINWIVATKTIEGGNYSSEETIHGNTVVFRKKGGELAGASIQGRKLFRGGHYLRTEIRGDFKFQGTKSI